MSLNFARNPFFKGTSFSVKVSMYVTIFSAFVLSSAEMSCARIKDKASSIEIPLLMVTARALPIADPVTGALKMLVCAVVV